MAQPQHGGPARRSLNVDSGPARRSFNVGGNPFGITSLTDPATELPWNHIVTKNIGGRGPLEPPPSILPPLQPLPLAPSEAEGSQPFTPARSSTPEVTAAASPTRRIPLPAPALSRETRTRYNRNLHYGGSYDIARCFA
jgi:hypothetical protein